MPADVRADASAAPDTAAADAPRVTGRDLLTAGIYAALVVGLALSGISNSGFLGEGPQWSRGVSVALLLAACASLCWRRSRPLVPFVVAGPLATAEIIGGGQISAYFLLFEALFVPVMHGSRRVARTCTAISIAAAAAAVLAALLGGLPGPAVFLVSMISGLMASTPLLWGWEVRHHREARGTAERLAGLEHELAESRAAQAVEAERRSIAHDLHDVIAGHLSAVALHSSLAARLRARDPSARVDIAPALTEPARVGPAVQAAALRIGAEAVTNAVRHGRAPIRLTAGIQEGAVRIELVNGRDGAEPLGAGMGRAALAHRALAVGGTASSGPAPDADGSPGWRVEAVLPLDASGDPPAEPPLTNTTLTATEASPR